MSDWRVSRSTKTVRPEDRLAQQTARFVATVVTPAPPLAE